MLFVLQLFVAEYVLVKIQFTLKGYTKDLPTAAARANGNHVATALAIFYLS